MRPFDDCYKLFQTRMVPRGLLLLQSTSLAGAHMSYADALPTLDSLLIEYELRMAAMMLMFRPGPPRTARGFPLIGADVLPFARDSVERREY